MVSFQTTFTHLNDHRDTVSDSDQDGSNSNNLKRKWDYAKDEEILPYKHWKTYPKAFTSKPFSDIELHLETPLPSEWQRCLDIQSGEIHFYNTRTQKRTVRDPRESLDPSSPRDCHMSLDLELNLPCGSLNHNFSKSTSEVNNTTTTTTTTTIKKRFSNSPPPQPPSTPNHFRSLRRTPEKTDNIINNNEAENETSEMVATACKRCHMLVMLCKSSPTCPNCKYVHPLCQNLLDLFKPRLSLSY
ncbi:Protein KIBRA [Bienertia sinuspersici]